MAINEEQAHHVLLVAFSAQGHINPMLRLGKRLLSKGLHVTFATTEFAGHRMLKSSFSPATTVSGIDLRFFSDGLSLDYDRKANLDHYMDTLGRQGPIHLTDLIKNHYPSGSNRHLSCLITNPFVPWVADVAAAHGVPCALVWIQPSTLYSIYYRFYNNLNSFPTAENPEMSVQLPGLPVLHTQDLPSFVLPDNPFGSFPKLFFDMFRNMNKFKWVLGNSFYKLEKDVTDSMTDILAVRPVGPLVPPSLLDQDENLDIGIDMWKHDGSSIEWLDRQENSSVTYVSFGSITVLSRSQMESVATALKKTTGPFLWVVKTPEGPASEDGAGQLPEGFLEETKDKGLVVPWCPQTKVLAHPAIALFLTHCGWNSMLESICAGVPVIGYPQWTDQPTNAKLITDVFRIGLRIGAGNDGSISSEEVLKCIEEIRGERYEEFKKNAVELKRAAREAVVDGGSSDRNIQMFVDEIVSGKNCGGGGGSVAEISTVDTHTCES